MFFFLSHYRLFKTNLYIKSNIPETELLSLNQFLFLIFQSVITQPWNLKTMFDSFPFLPTTLKFLLWLVNSCHLFPFLTLLFYHHSWNTYFSVFGLFHNLKNLHLSIVYFGWGEGFRLIFLKQCFDCALPDRFIVFMTKFKYFSFVLKVLHYLFLLS